MSSVPPLSLRVLLPRADGVSSAKIILSVVAALLLQLVMVRYLRIGRVDLDYLDLVLIVTVYCSFGRNPIVGMLVGAGSGLVQDSFSGALLGTQSFTKTLIAFLVGSLSVRVALDDLIPRVIVLGGASIINILVFVGLHWMFGLRLVDQPVWDTLFLHTAWHVLANIVAAIFVFLALDPIMRGEKRRSLRRSGDGRIRK